MLTAVSETSAPTEKAAIAGFNATTACTKTVNRYVGVHGERRLLDLDSGINPSDTPWINLSIHMTANKRERDRMPNALFNAVRTTPAKCRP